jgi:RHS repeat-associated protein
VWEYLLPDALGSVRQIADAAGNVTLAKSYEPYGSVLTSTGTASSIFGYAGEQLDTYIKLLFLRARYMNPRLGIFLARDPLMSASLYRYASSNPINRIEPSGYIDWQNCAIQGDYGTCTVTQGDWIYKIAREINAAGVSVNVPILTADIIALNPQTQWNPDYIQIGDRLTLRATWINAVLYGHAGPPAPTPQPPTPPVIDFEPWPLPPISLKQPDPNAPYYPPPPELLNGPVGYAIGWGGTLDYANLPVIRGPKVTVGTKCYEGSGKVGGFETVWDFRHLQKAEFHYDGITLDFTLIGASTQYYEGWITGLKEDIDDYSGWFATNFYAGSLVVLSGGGMVAWGLNDQGYLNGVKGMYAFGGVGLAANIGVDMGRTYALYEMTEPMLKDGINLRGSERIQFAEEFAEDFKTTALPLNGAFTTYAVTNLIKAWGRYDWE